MPHQHESPRYQAPIQSWVRFSFRHAKGLLIGALLVSLLAGWSASRLSINPRLAALLPESNAAAQSLKELKQRLKTSSPLYLLVQSDDIELSRKTARQLRDRVLRWEDTRWAMHKRDPTVFLDNRLLYLEARDLEALAEQIEERQRWEECEKIPGCENLDDEKPPLPTDDDLSALFKKNPDVRSLVGLFGKEASAFSTTSPSNSKSDGATGSSEELGELCDVARAVCSVQVSLAGDAGDLSYAMGVLERSQALFDELHGENPGRLKLVVSGHFRNLPMTKKQVSADLQVTTLLSVSLVLLVLLLQFRGFAGVLLLLLPAGMGILWTAGLLGAFHVQLNLISAFTLAVLAGVGIDFGVHLLTHYSEERGHGQPQQAALVRSLTSLMPSLVVAAFTTSSGFLALSAGSFKGFSQMGPIAATGIVVTLFVFLLLLPALIVVFDRRSQCSFELRRLNFHPWRSLQANAKWVAALGLAMAVLFGFLGRDVGFEYNFRKLRPAGVSHGVPWNETLHGTTRSAVYLLAEDAKLLAGVAKELRAEPPDKIVEADQPFMIVPGAFIPEQQPERLQAISELRKTIANAKKQASEELKRRIEEFEPLVAIESPLGLDDMPRWVSDWLVESDGKFGTLGVLYTKLSGADARDMEKLSREMESWRERFAGVRFASGVAQLGEVTPRLRAEAPLIIGLALLGVCLGTLLIGRSIRRTLLVLLPLFIGLALSFGLMSLLGMKLNLYNILVLPLAFGIGVDGAVYVTWAMGSGDARERLPMAARAVLGSTLTSAAGFGSLMISSNPGLASIGQLVVLMLLLSLLANLLWLPAYYWLRPRRA